jgi:hypothetical protein
LSTPYTATQLLEALLHAAGRAHLPFLRSLLARRCRQTPEAPLHAPEQEGTVSGEELGVELGTEAAAAHGPGSSPMPKSSSPKSSAMLQAYSRSPWHVGTYGTRYGGSGSAAPAQTLKQERQACAQAYTQNATCTSLVLVRAVTCSNTLQAACSDAPRMLQNQSCFTFQHIAWLCAAVC